MWDAPLYTTTKVTIELRDIICKHDNNDIMFCPDLWGECPLLLHPKFVTKPTYHNGEIQSTPNGISEEEVRNTVVNHFLFRQIGFETVGRFLHEWRQRTCEIAPHYRNITYAQSLLWWQDDPLESYKLTEKFTEENKGSSSGTSTGSGNSDVMSEVSTSESESGSKDITGSVTESKKHLFSDTPQGDIENVRSHISNGSIDDNTSANTDTENTSREGSGSTISESTSTDTSTATSNASAESSITRTLERRGNIGVQPLGDEVRKYQQAYDDIISMLIKEYEPLFLRVY